MQTPRKLSFACPAHLVEAIDRLASEEMLPRAAVIRRALMWETRAAGDLSNLAFPSPDRDQ